MASLRNEYTHTRTNQLVILYFTQHVGLNGYLLPAKSSLSQLFHLSQFICRLPNLPHTQDVEDVCVWMHQCRDASISMSRPTLLLQYARVVPRACRVAHAFASVMMHTYIHSCMHAYVCVQSQIQTSVFKQGQVCRLWIINNHLPADRLTETTPIIQGGSTTRAKTRFATTSEYSHPYSNTQSHLQAANH